jgi:hypothetical protein
LITGKDIHQSYFLSKYRMFCNINLRGEEKYIDWWWFSGLASHFIIFKTSLDSKEGSYSSSLAQFK